MSTNIDKQIDSDAVITKKMIRESLLQFISRQFTVDQADIQLDKSLIDTGIIDSMGLIEISTFISQTYNFNITVDNMTRQNFGSVHLMVDFIEKNIKSN